MAADEIARPHGRHRDAGAMPDTRRDVPVRPHGLAGAVHQYAGRVSESVTRHLRASELADYASPIRPKLRATTTTTMTSRNARRSPHSGARRPRTRDARGHPAKETASAPSADLRFPR